MSDSRPIVYFTSLDDVGRHLVPYFGSSLIASTSPQREQTTTTVSVVSPVKKNIERFSDVCYDVVVIVRVCVVAEIQVLEKLPEPFRGCCFCTVSLEGDSSGQGDQNLEHACVDIRPDLFVRTAITNIFCSKFLCIHGSVCVVVDMPSERRLVQLPKQSPVRAVRI
jgi:hypothetical protein